jgi:broad specificity phosphatase PhoE
MKLLLVRHGQSIANAEGRIQGQFDSPLSERGQAQARALAQRLEREGWNLAALYASDLQRAAETARIVAQQLDVPLTLDPRLREYDFGILTNLSWHEIKDRYPEVWHELDQADGWMSIPGAECVDEFRARLAAMLASIVEGHDEAEAVALVAHGGSLGMLLEHILELETRRPAPFAFANASLSLVEFGPRGPRLSLLNDTCHLDADLR